jgi:flagellar basal body-associated protein FliL
MNNNQETSSKKPIIIFISIIAIAALAYFYFLGSKTPDSSSTLSEANSASDATQLSGARVLNLLGQVSSLKIDKSLFESAAYQSLVDYTIEIPEQNIGRPNPFAPISGIVNDSTSTNKGR